jgi:hypothetical protein
MSMVTLSDTAYEYMSKEAARGIEFGVCLKAIKNELESDHDDATKLFWVKHTMNFHEDAIDEFINKREPKYDADKSAE